MKAFYVDASFIATERNEEWDECTGPFHTRAEAEKECQRQAGRDKCVLATIDERR